MTYEITRLDANDTTAMAALNGVFAVAFEDPANYTAQPPDETYLADLLARPEVIVLVARHAGFVIGGLVAYALPKLEQRRSEIYIYDLAVQSDMRRQGIARDLINHVQQIASDIGAWVVYVQADYEDPPAVKLYTTLGTREEVLHFDIPPQRPD